MKEQELWVVIPNFPNYSVSSFGRVINNRHQKEMFLSPTQYGDLTVGMVKNRKQYRRSVKVLVARAFVEGENDVDDTPMLLDGNRSNLHHSNIVWRPRWLAWKYIRQFNDPKPYWDRGPIEDRAGNRYESIIIASMTIGSLAKDIMWSTVPVEGYTRVRPGGETFRFVGQDWNND